MAPSFSAWYLAQGAIVGPWRPGGGTVCHEPGPVSLFAVSASTGTRGRFLTPCHGAMVRVP